MFRVEALVTIKPNEKCNIIHNSHESTVKSEGIYGSNFSINI